MTVKRALGMLGLLGIADAARHYVSARRGTRKLKSELNQGKLRIIVGASGKRQDGWISTDAEYLNLLEPDGWQKSLGGKKLDAILAEHVWEHLTLDEGLRAAKICHQYLKAGGYLRIAVPDANHPDPRYIEDVRVGGTGPGAHDHKVLYDYRSLPDLLSKAGFQVKLLEYFDEHGNFAFNDWDPVDGLIHRSKRFDERNRDGVLGYTSLIVDAIRP